MLRLKSLFPGIWNICFFWIQEIAIRIPVYIFVSHLSTFDIDKQLENGWSSCGKPEGDWTRIPSTG